MAELCLISFSSSELKLNPIGDILAIVAAFIWAVCSLLTRKSSRYGYNTIQTTRRIFAYGILFILPFLFFLIICTNEQKIAKPEYVLNLI